MTSGIMLPEAPILAAGLSTAVWISPDGEVARGAEEAEAIAGRFRKVIPKVTDIDPFHRSGLRGDFYRQSGARRAVVPAASSDARRRWRHKSPGPEGGATRPDGCPETSWATLARCGASRRAPRLPGGPIGSHERGQYQ